MSSNDRTGSKNPVAGSTETTRTDLAQEILGNNALQGNNQSSVRNQRQAQADVKQDTDGVIESFEKLDKDVRAKTDLGKDNRGGGNGRPPCASKHFRV